MVQRCRKNRSNSKKRRGVAAVEMAVVLPLLVLLFVLGVDFARIFHFSLTVTNCARNGALHAADVDSSPFDTVQEAVLAEGKNLTTTPTIEVKSGFNGGQEYTDVTVRYEFRTVTNYLSATTPITIVRTVRAEHLPKEPNF